MKKYGRFVLAGLVSIVAGLALYSSCLIGLAQSIESGLLLFTAGILIFYTVETQKMKEEIVNQTAALLSPSIAVRFLQVKQSPDGGVDVLLEVYNYSAENIARNFCGQLYYDKQKIDEKALHHVIGFTGSNFKTASPQKISMKISQRDLENNKVKISPDNLRNHNKLRFEYCYYERTGKFKFRGKIRSLYEPNLWG